MSGSDTELDTESSLANISVSPIKKARSTKPRLFSLDDTADESPKSLMIDKFIESLNVLQQRDLYTKITGQDAAQGTDKLKVDLKDILMKGSLSDVRKLAIDLQVASAYVQGKEAVNLLDRPGITWRLYHKMTSEDQTDIVKDVILKRRLKALEQLDEDTKRYISEHPDETLDAMQLGVPSDLVKRFHETLGVYEGNAWQALYDLNSQTEGAVTKQQALNAGKSEPHAKILAKTWMETNTAELDESEADASGAGEYADLMTDKERAAFNKRLGRKDVTASIVSGNDTQILSTDGSVRHVDASDIFWKPHPRAFVKGTINEVLHRSSGEEVYEIERSNGQLVYASRDELTIQQQNKAPESPEPSPAPSPAPPANPVPGSIGEVVFLTNGDGTRTKGKVTSYVPPTLGQPEMWSVQLFEFDDLGEVIPGKGKEIQVGKATLTKGLEEAKPKPMMMAAVRRKPNASLRPGHRKWVFA